jgi:CMP-N-acetylneuraminic acid synthetase
VERLVSRCIGIILARGGSKRLPGKNLLDLGGKPMLQWTIDAALSSGCFHRVLLSTDDEKIADIGRQCGAEVPFLRNSAADDHAPSSAATLVALSQAETFWEEKYDSVAQMMANCPFRTAADIRAGMRQFLDRGAPSQLSVFRFGWMNPWWAARMRDDAEPEYLFPEARSSRSQDLPALYCPSGALWIASAQSLVESGTFYCPGHVLFPIDWVSAIDIDDEADLQMARVCLALRGGREGSD